jgi:NADH-quinone oxidoreductase subunit H
LLFFTLAERKFMGAIQRRSGPNIVGFLGLLQPVADGLKLIIKEIIIPKRANAMLFLLAPYLAFVLSVIGWSVIPFGPGNVISDINLSVIYIFAVSSLGAYSIIMAGYSSHSRYSFLGSLRAAAQMVSYEVALGFVIICIAICSGSLSLTSIVLAQTEVQGI